MKKLGFLLAGCMLAALLTASVASAQSRPEFIPLGRVSAALYKLRVPKNAREDKLAARKRANMSPEEIREHMEMERLYRQQVVKEKPTIQIQGLGGGKNKQDVQPVVHKDVV